MGPSESPESSDPLETLLDVFLYAPIGLILTRRDQLPELAARGRAETAAARAFGTMALSLGDARVQRVFGDLGEQLRLLLDTVAGDPASAARARRSTTPSGDTTESAPITTETSSDEPVPDVADLALEGYDSLAASQIIPRLEGLQPDERESIARYEAANRRRKTILDRIRRLDRRDGD